ncbi:hypothetical protein ACTFIR_007146 [Dictyostelium discoideum]
MRIILLLFLIVFVVVQSSSSSSSSSSGCPCDSSYLCEPLQIAPRQEFLGFSLNSTQYPNYYWNQLTTLAIFYETIEDELLCIAHENDVRLVWGTTFPIGNLGNSSYIEEWIQGQIEKVQSTFTDGLNFDVESPITDPTIAQQYTELVSATNKAFKAINPFYQISIDVAWSPSCIDKRCYDYAGLASNSDFLVAMDYDERSQVFGEKVCTAGANSSPSNALAGINNFTDLGISTDQLVMGLPWYGYIYKNCLNGDEAGLETVVCEIESVPFRGANCSDAAGSEYDYSYLVQLLQDQTINSSAVQWNTEWQSPYFNYIDPITGNVDQVWFDNPQSLSIKVQLAQKLNLRGVAVWNIDFLDFSDQYNSRPMWDALASFFPQSASSEQSLN